MSEQPDLSVVILCYRGEKYILPFVEEVHKELDKSKIGFELVLVANYDLNNTQDQTPQIIKDLARKDPRYICLTEPKKGRMGWDLRHGLAKTHGRYIAFVDGDGQSLASDIIRLYTMMCKSQVDLCKIYRAHRADPLIRKIISKIYNFIFRLFFPGYRIRDVNAKPKLMTRRAYENMQLVSNDWFADAEIILEARRLKLKVSELLSETRENNWRKSFIGVLAILEFLKNMIIYRIKYWFFR